MKRYETLEELVKRLRRLDAAMSKTGLSAADFASLGRVFDSEVLKALPTLLDAAEASIALRAENERLKAVELGALRDLGWSLDPDEMKP